MRVFAESSVCAVTSRLILMCSVSSISDAHFQPDSSIFTQTARHKVIIEAASKGKEFLICKEELGNIKGECLYKLFPTPTAQEMVRPIFLFRDPVRVFDSWKKVGWTDIKSLIDCYSNMFGMLDDASPVLYERLICEPHREVMRICALWEIPFSESMLSFDKPFGSSFLFSSAREKDIYCMQKPLGLFANVEAHSSIRDDLPCHGLLSNGEKDILEERLGRLYLELWRDDVLRLREIIKEKPWIGFDLDDTLHEFRYASGQATIAVLEMISSRHGTPVVDLKETYAHVLKQRTSNAFSDGKTSIDYRRERFLAVLAIHNHPSDSPDMTAYLDLYEATLTASLQLKCGALALLSRLKGMGKRIVIITEGPQDAQERAIQALGIGKYVDFLATTNHPQFRIAKTRGLFPKVLGRLGISAGDIAYIGDSDQRDMVPAMAEGIFSIHLDEQRHISLAAFPPRINTLRKLEYIICDNGH